MTAPIRSEDMRRLRLYGTGLRDPDLAAAESDDYHANLNRPAHMVDVWDAHHRAADTARIRDTLARLGGWACAAVVALSLIVIGMHVVPQVSARLTADLERSQE